MGKKLSKAHQRFVEEYLVDCNATQAAIRAGYKAKNADVTGPRLLGNVGIAEAIALRQAARSATMEVNSATALKELANLSYSDIGDILDFSGKEPRLKPASEIPPHARRCISAIKVKRHLEGKGDDAREVEIIEFKLWSPGAKLRDLLQHLGLLRAPEAPPVPPAPPSQTNLSVSVTNVMTGDFWDDVAKLDGAFERARGALTLEAKDGERPAGSDVRPGNPAQPVDPAKANAKAG